MLFFNWASENMNFLLKITKNMQVEVLRVQYLS